MDALPSVVTYFANAKWTLTAVGFSSILLYYFSLFVYNAFFHPLARFPGPRFRSATPFVSLWGALKGDQAFDYATLHDIYGPVVRIGPNTLSYITATAWREIYGMQEGKAYRQMPKDPVQYASQPGRTWSILNAPIAMHTRIRRQLGPSFSEKSLRSQEPLISRYVDLLIHRLRERTSQKVNLTDWLNFTSFDIIGDLAYAEPFNCLQDSKMHPWIEVTFDFMKAAVYIQILRWIPGALALMNALLPSELRKSRDYHMSLTSDKVRKRIAVGSDRQDFMNHIVSTMNEKDGLSVGELEATSEVIIIAGSETTATLLSGCFYYLLTNPLTYQRLVDEIRGAFTSEEEIGYESVKSCKYMTAVLDETLRIYPPVPTSMQRMVPEGGGYVEGKWVPGGTIVGVAHWAAYHSESNFRDPHKFVPERFLGDARYKDDKIDVLQPFSYGPRNCIGKSLAYLEMRLILARIIWNFNLELLPESMDWAQQKVYVLWLKPPLYVKLSLAR